MTKYPALNEYNGAVQNPRLAFSDSTLKMGKVETTGVGLPRALGGGFAITYTVDAAGRKYAVRCFHKPAPELEKKYQSVSAALSSDHSGYFVGFEYQPGGVLVNGTRYPIVKMDWVEGKTFGAWLEANASKRSNLENVRRQFSDMEAYLRGKSLAHGDIQNGNVIIAKSPRLIDYDGIYVPGLLVGQGTELGHKHFQHPKRSMADFGPTMDRFSFILVDLSFSAVIERPSLFQKYSNGENIIFTASDFKDPSQSALFQELWTSSSLKQHALHFARICSSPVKDVPTLPDFLAGRNIPASIIIISSPKASAPPSPRVYIGAFDVVDPLDYAEVQRRVGDRIELVGKIEDVRVDRTRHGKPYVFLNFGNWRLDQAKITIWSEGLARLSQQPDKSWKGKWISVTGLVDPPFKNKRHKYTHVGITVTEPNQLRIIDEQEARRRIASGKSKTKGTQSGSTNVNILKGLKKGGSSSISTPASTTNQQILKSLGGLSSQPSQRQPAQTYKPTPPRQKSNSIAAAIGFALIKIFSNSGTTVSTQTYRQSYTPSTQSYTPPVQNYAPSVQRNEPSAGPPVMQTPLPQVSPGPFNVLPPQRTSPNSANQNAGSSGTNSDDAATPSTSNGDESLQPLPPPVEIDRPPGPVSQGLATDQNTSNNDESTQRNNYADQVPTNSDVRYAPFLGGWAAAASDCNVRGSGAPLIITTKNAETSGGSCQFYSTQKDGAGWRIKARCEVEGKSWIAHIKLTTAGNHLTWSSERGTDVYVRCAAN